MFDEFNVAFIALLSFIITKFFEMVFRRKKREPEPKKVYSFISESPTPLILLSGVFGFSLYPIIPPSGVLWFGLILLILALLTPIVGYSEGLIVGLRLNNWRLHPYSEVKYLAKYGGISKHGKLIHGRFDISSEHVIFAGLCNVSGAACSMALLIFLHSLPGFEAFRLANPDRWVTYLEALLTFCVFYALSDVSTKQYTPSSAENPKNFQLNRLHVWVNFFHLTFTFFYCFLTVLFIIDYAVWSKVYGTAAELPIQFILPIIALFAFLTYALGSITGNKYGPEAAKGYLPAIVGLCVGAVILMILFELSYVHFITVPILVFLLFLAKKIVDRARAFNTSNAKTNIMFWTPLVATTIVLGLVALIYILRQ